MTIDPVVIDKRPRSLVHMFLERVEETPDEDAFYYPVEGGWQESTWGQTHELVEGLAAGLLALGIEPEERVAIIASTRYEWVLGYLATLWAGGRGDAGRPGADDDTMARPARRLGRARRHRRGLRHRARRCGGSGPGSAT